ncbi:TIGR04222 domain-containing membrane protein [Labedaea rhizosphaerae]|uniref:Uncharacterized protein (TIGR04222 family) n=1 Tax=Labedaea rhizosphaerae TaxID=598644 RepID=A0A4R6SK65_LABRH|nr:TIGR04222 domain-containing membrane protein [Labedaea rhizosphaerae]TDQ01418.1 uncharacterized protein (TIGR04222 family) [Labedaea rhizosphaerae]
MNEAWGISESRFFWIHLGLLVAPAIAAPLVRGWLQNRRKPDGPVRSGLTAHHLAYLSASPLVVGGAVRAVESAVAALLHAGRLRVDAEARLSRIGKAEPADPFERAVFARVRSGIRIAELPIEVRPALAKLSDDLAERGLALRERAVVAYRSTILVVYMAIWLFGFVRAAAELKVHRVTWVTGGASRTGTIHGVPQVVPLLFLGGLLVLSWAYLAWRGKRDYITRAGRNFVLEAIASWRAGTPGPGGLTIEGTAVVAIAGIVGYPDKKIASAFVGRPVVD